MDRNIGSARLVRRFAENLKRRLWAPGLLAVVLAGMWLAGDRTPAPAAGSWLPTVLAGGLRSETDEMADASKTVGPDGNNDNACSKCHVLEYEAWQNSHHFSTFGERHKSPRAQEIIKKMGWKSMKRQGECRQCHYTSVVDSGKIVPTWGVSCESCHGPAAEWVGFHNKVGANPTGTVIKWGTGKNEPPADHAARLKAAQAKGMLSSQMIYEIATNCFGCHTVPDETLVNKGGHKAGSDFDLVAWSQGEVRHNFISSAGAPDHPTNRRASPEQLRRLYVVGALVDLQFSLRNVVAAKEKGGEFDKAMVDRVNRARAKVAAILAKAPIPELDAAVKAVPEKVDTTTAISADLPEKLAAATKMFAASNDGTKLAAVDALIPTKYMGAPYKE